MTTFIPRLLCMGGDKKSLAATYTLFEHASSPTISGNSVNLFYYTMLISPVWKMPATDHTLCGWWRRTDEGISSSLTGIIQVSIHSSQMLWHVTDTIFPLEADYNHLDMKQLRRSGLSAGQHKFLLQITKRTLAHVLTVCARLSFLFPCTRAWERFITTAPIYRALHGL